MTDKPEDPELIAIHPVHMSMSGRNSTYFFCHRRQQAVSYAVCLHTLKAINENRIAGTSFEECSRAHLHNDCYAKDMLKEELAAGHALYYKERIILTPVKAAAVDGAVSTGKYDMNNPSYARGWAIGGGPGEPREPRPTQKRNSAKPTRNIGPIKKSGFVEEGMADVVNVLMQENADNKKAKAEQKPTTPTVDQSSTRPLPGESTADFIKRRAAMKVKP